MEQLTPFGQIREQVADMARAFSGFPDGDTDRRSPAHVTARRRAANKRARATRQAQRRG